MRFNNFCTIGHIGQSKDQNNVLVNKAVRIYYMLCSLSKVGGIRFKNRRQRKRRVSMQFRSLVVLCIVCVPLFICEIKRKQVCISYTVEYHHGLFYLFGLVLAGQFQSKIMITSFHRHIKLSEWNSAWYSTAIRMGFVYSVLRLI